jgi:hypothetical protein
LGIALYFKGNIFGFNLGAIVQKNIQLKVRVNLAKYLCRQLNACQYTGIFTNNFALPCVPASIVDSDVWSPSPTSSLKAFTINWCIISLFKPLLF